MEKDKKEAAEEGNTQSRELMMDTSFNDQNTEQLMDIEEEGPDEDEEPINNKQD